MKPLSSKPIVVGVLVLIVAALGWWGVQARRSSNRPAAAERASLAGEAAAPTNKIIVGEQAQKNLGLSSRPLKVTEFWKTITLPGMIVDRPGVSDREVVAPTTGVITRVFHVPGDVVRPADVLFTLKLTSESVHESQTGLFKANQEIALDQDRLKRLVNAGEGVAQARVLEVKQEIARSEAMVKSLRHDLVTRGFSLRDLDGVAAGEFVSELRVLAPQDPPSSLPSDVALLATSASDQVKASVVTFEVQQLKVEVGQQVEAGETLCLLSNHERLAIQGQAFRDETLLLERSIEAGWPVEVDFQEPFGGDWPQLEQTFYIRHLANTVDPVTRTFSFMMPLTNQSKAIRQGELTQFLWRFRPGQKVRLKVRVEKLDDVFVLPADAVVREGAEAFVFTQNVNTFERKGVQVVFHDREHLVIANDGSLPTYPKKQERWTLAAVALGAAAQLNRMAKAGSSEIPKGFHVHADGSLHKNEEEGK